jgi:peptide/nickel transport system permease protein
VFTIIALLIASILIFTLTAIVPGDVAQMILGQNATPESLLAIRKDLGLDKAAHVRYFEWVWDILHGDLGTSLSMRGVSVSSLLIQKGKNSLFLATFAALFLIPVSLGLGIISGLKEGSWADNLISTSSLIALSLPEFISGTFFVLVFSVWLGVLPVTATINPNKSLLSQFDMLVLPILTISLVLLGYVARMVRVSIIEVSRADYIRTAILKGMPRSRLVAFHILPNALLPAITVIAMNVGWLMGGIVVVETVFGFPGLGRLVLFAIKQRDMPLIQSVILVIAAAYLALNLAADIIYGALNPQVKYDKR